MSHRLTLAALAVALPATIAASGSTASAQGAPGSCDCYAPPPYLAAVPAPDEVDLSNRLGVGLHAVSMAIVPHDDPDADPTELAGGGLQVRYRVSRRWELGLELATMRQHDDNGEPFGENIHVATVGAHFRMRPGRHLDWYFSGGLGGLHVGEHDDDEAEERGRALGYLGIGLEYRWQHLALGAEVRAVGIAPAEETRGARMSTGDDDDDERGDGAAQATVGATYYF
jgi:hypothetical protein